MIKYEIELPSSRNKVGFNLLDDEYFIIPYITDTISNSPVVHQLSAQAKWNLWIIDFNVEEVITAQCALDELDCHQTPRGKSKFKICLCRRKIYQRIELEDIRPRFDQVRPVVSHIEVCIPKKHSIPNSIDEGLKGPFRKFWKEDLFVQYEKNKNVSLLLDPTPIKSLIE